MLDFTGVGRADISSETICEPARTNPLTHGSRRAIVVVASHKYGLARIYQSYTERSDDTVMVIGDPNAAALWLGINVQLCCTTAAAI